MPNWTHNTVRFQKIDDEDKFKKLIEKVNKFFETEDEFHGLFLYLLESNETDIHKEIGTKWDTSMEELRCINKDEVVVVGDTPWGPPVEGLRKVSEKYSCRVVDTYVDEMWESGVVVCEKGEVVEDVHFETRVDEVYYYLQKGDEEPAKSYVKSLKTVLQVDDPTIVAYEMHGDKQKILEIVEKYGDDKLYAEVELYLKNKKGV